MHGISIKHLSTTIEPIIVSNDPPILKVVSNPNNDNDKELTIDEIYDKIINCKASNIEIKTYLDSLPRSSDKTYVPYALR